MTDFALEAAHRRAIYRSGVSVTFRRKALGASSQIDAAVIAVVRNVSADGSGGAREGYPGSKPGSPTMADRQIIAMKADLAAGGFPLPVAKGDRVLVAETGEWLQIELVDNTKRAVAGCVEMTAKGVA